MNNCDKLKRVHFEDEVLEIGEEINLDYDMDTNEVVGSPPSFTMRSNSSWASRENFFSSIFQTGFILFFGVFHSVQFFYQPDWPSLIASIIFIFIGLGFGYFTLYKTSEFLFDNILSFHFDGERSRIVSKKRHFPFKVILEEYPIHHLFKPYLISMPGETTFILRFKQADQRDQLPYLQLTFTNMLPSEFIHKYGKNLRQWIRFHPPWRQSGEHIQIGSFKQDFGGIKVDMKSL